MHYDREFRREERRARVQFSTPPPAWTMGVALVVAKDRSLRYGAQIFGALRFS